MLKRISTFLIFFIQAQLFVVLVSLPILISWGLPVSLMSMVANFIFSPVIMLFIMLSSLLFFTQLCSIPNGLIAWSLNHLVTWWHYILEHGSQRWLYAFACPSKIELAIMLALPIILIMHRMMNTHARRIISMGILLIVTLSYLTMRQGIVANPAIQTNKELLIINHGNSSVSLIDKGFFARKQSPYKAVTFDLKPLLAKRYGTNIIANLTINNVIMRSLQGALACCQELRVQQVTLPFFKELDKKGWKTFFELKKFLHEKNILLKRIHVEDKKRKPRRIKKLSYGEERKLCKK